MLERLIATIDAEAQAQSVKDERFVRDQRILDELAPRVWQSLKAALKAESEKYPQHFKYEIRTSTEAAIRGKNGRVLESEYLSESKRVVSRCNDKESECVILLNAQNRAIICDCDGMPYPSVDFLAEELLAQILK